MFATPNGVKIQIVIGSYMNPQDAIKQAQEKFSAQLAHFNEELKKLRTGRAHPSMLDGITATAYGTPMPLNQLATISQDILYKLPK